MSAFSPHMLFGSSEFFANPYPYYRLLQENEPVYWSEDLQSWLVTRHAYVQEGLSRAEFSSKRNRIAGMEPAEREQLADLQRFYSDWLMYSDPPEHNEIKRFLTRAMSDELIESAQKVLRHETKELVKQIERRGRMNIVEEYASRLTIPVLCRLVGVDTRDSEMIERWSESIVSFLGKRQPTLLDGLNARESARELMEYLNTRASRAKNLPEHSLLSAIATRATPSLDSRRQALLAAIANVLVDGHAPVVAAFSNSLIALASRSDLPNKPAGEYELTGDTLEELLRYDPPFQYAARVAKRESIFRSKRIREGERIMFMLGIANRDARVFSSPDQLWLKRGRNRHVSFGYGAHFCLGAKLSRMILRELFLQLFTGLPGFSVGMGGLTWKQSVGYRQVEHLDISW